MRLAPWSQVKSWHCTACGICCRDYAVTLKLPEWINIVKIFGVEYTVPSINKFFLRKKANGSCVFLYETPNQSYCSLQQTKPQACKLWPFNISTTPKSSNPDSSVYYYKSRKFHVYADPTCRGLKFGPPSREFAYHVLPEFIEIALGIRHTQYKTTAFL